MNIVQITPGAGGMYCGNCFRDNALVAELRKEGHQTLMIPLYLPMTLEEEDHSQGTPIFFGGISVYLEQKVPFLRRMPDWLRKLLASPALLKWASGRAASTRAEEVGDLMLSMLRGEDGHQAGELATLIAWLKTQPKPDAICLSNALLIGLARRLRRELGAPVFSMLQGEDAYLDSMPEPQRSAAWELLAERARDVERFITPSRYFAERMAGRLRVAPGRICVMTNGIKLADFPEDLPPEPNPPVLGFFARMCKDKGLDLLVDAYLDLRRGNRVPGLKLKVGGGCGPGDEPFVAEQRRKLEQAGVAADAEFHPNVDRQGKIGFLRSLSVLSVPALYGEAFGLYLIEAMAAGVPVVQPRVAAFPEIIEAAQSGLLAEASPRDLADKIEYVLTHPKVRRDLAVNGQRAARANYGVEHMARKLVEIFQNHPEPPSKPA
jgi:glycosyltransferase involved in cell wall biosynthesis